LAEDGSHFSLLRGVIIGVIGEDLDTIEFKVIEKERSDKIARYSEGSS
jgi:hypothetical protein